MVFPSFTEVSIAFTNKIPLTSILNSTEILVSPFGFGVSPSIIVSFKR